MQGTCCVVIGRRSWGSFGSESQTSSHSSPTSPHDTLQAQRQRQDRSVQGLFGNHKFLYIYLLIHPNSLQNVYVLEKESTHWSYQITCEGRENCCTLAYSKRSTEGVNIKCDTVTWNCVLWPTHLKYKALTGICFKMVSCVKQLTIF